MKVLPKGKIRYRLNPRTQLIEGIDEDSGQVISVQQSHDDFLRQTEERSLVEVKTKSGKTVMVEKGVDLTRLKGMSLSQHKFSQVWADLICEKIESGESISKISKTKETKNWPGPSVVARWRREHPEFEKQLQAARKAKADFFADKVVETADNTKEYNAKAARVKVDAYKWGAAVHDPETYGSRTKVVGDPDKPITFFINTGVSRDPIPLPIDPSTERTAIDVTPQAPPGTEPARDESGENRGGEHGGSSAISPGTGHSIEGDGGGLVDQSDSRSDSGEGFENWDGDGIKRDTPDVKGSLWTTSDDNH